MKLVAPLLVLSSLFTASVCGAQTKVDKRIQLNADGALRIYSLVGSIRVVGWNRDSVGVRGTLGKGSSFHMGGGKTGAKMFVEALDDRNPEPSHLEVSVPIRAKVWVKTATADIDVSGVAGSLDLYVVGGSIRVAGNPTDVNAEAIDGSIRIIGSAGWVRAKSASGGVSFKGTSANVTMSTVSGDITAEGMNFEKARFETVTGAIRFSGGVERGGLINIDSHSGVIDVGVSGGISADFDIVSIAGTISNKITKHTAIKGKYGRGSELSLTNGDGGARVAVRSFKGPVTLRRTD